MNQTPPSPSTLDYLGASVGGAVISAGSFVGARLLGSLGYLPPLAAEVVDSATVLALITGGTGALATVLGFWIKFRGQNTANDEREEQAIHAERQALAAERAAVLTELRGEIDTLKAARQQTYAQIEALQLTIAGQHHTIIEQTKQISLYQGVIIDQRREMNGGGGAA